MHRVRAGKLVVPAVVLLWSCAGEFVPGDLGGPEAPAPLDVPASGTWVGALEGRDAFVAVVANEAAVVAYVCEDGVLGTWFFGPPGAGLVELQAASGARVELTLAERVEGRFLLDGVAWPFAAERSADAALLRADAVVGEAPLVAGWIRLGGRTQGTLSLGGTLEPAPQLTGDSVSLTIDDELVVLSPAPMAPSTLTMPTPNTTRFAWAATGDSYGSGEGNPEQGIANPANIDDFSGLRWADDLSTWVSLAGTSLAAEAFACHRSDQAGAPKAHRRLQGLYPGVQFALGFVACSGAESRHLVDTDYPGPVVRPEAMRGHERPLLPPQLQRVSTFRQAQGRLDALFMSIGGNDVGFGQILEDCLNPLFDDDCAEPWERQLTANLERLAGNYDALEAALVSRFGQALPVLISHYPNPLHDGSEASTPVCAGPDYDAHADVGLGGHDDPLQDNVTAGEARWAFDVPRRLNAAVSAAATRHGWTVVDQHVRAFEGHGVCTARPWANLNSRALHRQGHDVPDTFTFVFSFGFMHPNNDGYEAYADALVARLRPLVDARVRTGLTAPANLRVGAAESGGALTLHWNDRATAENGYEVEVLPAREEDLARLAPPAGSTLVAGGGFRARVSGIGVELFTHRPSGPGQFKYRARACHTSVRDGSSCGPFSAQVLGTNVAPARLENVRVSTRSVTVNGALRLETVLAWDAQPGAIEYVARIERLDGSEAPSERRTTSTFVSAPALQALYRYRAAACNRVGCSLYRAAP